MVSAIHPRPCVPGAPKRAGGRAGGHRPIPRRRRPRPRKGTREFAPRRLHAGAPPGHVRRRFPRPRHPPAHAPGPSRPRRVHVCVSGCGMGAGAAPPEGRGPATSRRRGPMGGGLAAPALVLGQRGGRALERGLREPAGKKGAERAEGALAAAWARAPGAGPGVLPASRGRRSLCFPRRGARGSPRGRRRDRGGRKGGRPLARPLARPPAPEGLAGTQESGRREGRVRHRGGSQRLAGPGVRAGGRP